MPDTEILKLIEQLLEAKEAYYNSESPIMSDSEFDSLEERLKNLDPSNEYFLNVGSSQKGDNKVIHSEPMLSMQKGKTVEDIVKWMEKIDASHGINYCVQPKIDGLSATCKYKDGKLVYVATRGDGQKGQDVTHIADYLEDIKREINFCNNDIEIRGELYLPKDTIYDTKGRPLRNNCVGLINRKENREDLQFVRFAAYQIAGKSDIETESEKIETLIKSGFNSVKYFKISKKNDLIKIYNEYLDSYRKEWLYETDGLVVVVDDNSLFEEIDSRWVVDHHHHYAIALKPPSEAKASRLIDVIWQVSRQGNVIPVALFEPVFIGGARIERATLNNYENVVNLDLRKNDELVVERANDVIPFVRGNNSIVSHDDSQSNDFLITECPSCNSRLVENGVHRRCINQACDEIRIQQIIYWVRQAEIETVAEATIRTLYEKGKISSIKDLYELKAEDFEGLEGFAEKKISKIMQEIANKKTLSSIDFLSRMGIPLVQKKSLQKLSINTLSDFLKFNDDSYIIGQNIIEWKKDEANMAFLDGLAEILNITESKKTESKGRVCMTGSGPRPRKELIADIEAKGYEFTSSITKDTDILLCDDITSGSSKLKKAESLNIKIMNYEDFFNN